MKSFMFVAVAAAVLGGLFLFFKPARLADEPPVAVAPAATPPAATVSSPAPAPVVPPAIPAAETPLEPNTLEVIVKDGKVVSGNTLLKARQGDEVTLKITSDAADEVHVHGYDRHAQVKPGETTTLRIKATRTGRFPFELHKSRLELGTLEIYPR
jgi:hypothetical protein